MAITAVSGPFISFGNTLTSTGGYAEYNGQAGPSVFYEGVAVLDSRAFNTYAPGSDVTDPVNGWLANGDICVIDQVPTVISTNSIVLTQSATTTTTRTLTLTTSNTNNATVNVSIIAPETGVTVSGLLAIDTPLGTINYGSDGTVRLYNPNTMISRCLTITSSVNDSGGAYTITGRDLYGYPMTETIVGPNATTVTGQKAWKYIATIVASGTINSTGVTIGVSDVYGFPLAVTAAPFATISISSGTSFGTVTGSTGVTTWSTRATQTSTTPDVRGTWSSTTASDGTRRITMFIAPNPTFSSTISGFVGQPQS